MSHLTQALLDELSQRAQAARRARAYYENKTPEIFFDQKILKLLRGSQHFRRNYIRIVVRSVHDRLGLEDVLIEPESAAQAVEAIGQTLDLGSMLDELMLDALVEGDYYAHIWPSATGGVDVVPVGPANMLLTYEPGRPDAPASGLKVWLEDGRWRIWFATPQLISRYEIPRDGKASEVPGLDIRRAVPYETDEEPAEEPNIMGEIPVAHFRTRRPYGEPEHADGYGPADAINKLIAAHMSTVDFQSIPQRYALENPDGNSGSATIWDEDDDTPDADSKGKPAYKAGPGTIWWMDAKSVGQFEVADPAVFLEPLQDNVEAMASTTSTPMFHLIAGPQSPSGAERRASESPLIAKIRRRHRTFEAGIRRFYRLIGLAAEAEPESVTVRWADPAGLSETEIWQVAEAKIAAGVPREQVLIEAGYEKEQAQEWAGTREGVTDGD